MNIGDLFKSGIAGAGAGSAFGPWGALGGAGIGLLGQMFGGNRGGQSGGGILGNEFLSGSPHSIISANRFAPEQVNLMSQLGQMGMQGFNDPYQGFGAIKDNAMNTFNTEIVPSILERFNAIGDNALSSPSLHMQLGQGSKDFARELAAMQSQYGLQNRNQMLEMMNMSLNPQYQNFEKQAQGGLLQQVLPSMGILGSSFLGNYLGGSTAKDSLANAFKLLSGAN